MSYLGNTPTDQSFVATVDYFNGDGSTVAFTLSRQVASIAQVQAVIENVPQNPSQAFSVLGNVITFTSAPPSGSANIYVYYTSPNTKVMAPSAGTVDTVALAAAAVTSVKMANSGYEFGMRNRIINGDMKIDQRNAGLIFNSKGYCIDRFATDGNVSSWNISQQQVDDAPAGFNKSLKVINTAAGTATASQFAFVRQIIEGTNIADLNWGTPDAATITISFKVKSSISGTYSLYLVNHSEDRSYVSEFVITNANVWETKTITIVGDTSGTWLTNNSNGIRLGIDLGSGSNYIASSNNTWGSGWKQRTSNTVNFSQTNGATFQITGVQLEKGPVATPFEYRPYGTELALCQRYYYRITGGGNTRHAISGNGGNTNCFPVVFFKTSMRATPSFSYSTLSDFVIEGFAGGQGTPTGLSWNAGTTENAAINSSGQSGITGSGGNLLGTGSGAWTAWSAEL